MENHDDNFEEKNGKKKIQNILFHRFISVIKLGYRANIKSSLSVVQKCVRRFK